MKFRPAAAFVLMLLMLVFAVSFGAYQGWNREKAQLEEAEGAALNAMLRARAESAYNLMTVAKRHVPESDGDFQAVRDCRQTLSDEKGAYTLAQKAAANESLTAAANALLTKLEDLDSVRQDSRDLMYVQSLLPQMLKESNRTAVGTAYNEAAAHFNQTMTGSLSGALARRLGVDVLPLFTAE